jgi:AcrR family transcriptional regulator
LLAARLRRGERGLSVLEADLLGWLAAHNRPAEDHRWRTINVVTRPARSPFVPEAPLRPPPPLSLAQPRPSPAALAENQRLRIIFATAEAVQAHGYIDVSVAEITRLAGVDGRAFYRLFADKQDALMAVHELGFQRTMAATAGAFFSAAEWPARIWEAARAFTQCIGQNPTLGHVSLIESRAGAPETVQRFDDLMAGFTIFLQEGYHYRAVQDGHGPSALALEAVAAANFEALYGQARSSAPAMNGLLAQLSYMCFTQFIGPARASELIDELMAAEGSTLAPTRVAS